MMKRVGYKPDFAAGVEATAAVGGQILPPIMGAAAFIMAETLGVPYITIAVAALINDHVLFRSAGTGSSPG